MVKTNKLLDSALNISRKIRLSSSFASRRLIRPYSMLFPSSSLNRNNFSKTESPIFRNYPQIYSRSFAEVSVDVSKMMEQLKNTSFKIDSSFFSPFGSDKIRNKFVEIGGLPVLLNYYDKSTGDNHSYTFIALSLFFMDSKDTILKLIDHGLLPQLLNSINIKNFSRTVIMALCNISYELYETKQMKEFADKVVPILINYINNNNNNFQPVDAYIPKVFINMSFDPNSYKQLICKPVFELLNKMLESKDDMVKTNSLACLTALIKKDEKNAVDLYVEVAPFDKIFELLYSNNKTFSSYSSLLLRNMISNNLKCVNKLDSLGYVDKIIEKSKSDNAEAKLFSTVTLANICGPKSETVRHKLLFSGVIPQLLSLCHNNNMQVQEAAIMGISNLSTDSNEVRRTILNSELIPALESVLANNNEKAYDYATFTLTRLYFGSKEMLDILKQENKHPLLELLETKCLDEKKRDLIILRTLICISVISTNCESKQREYILESGIIEKALELYEGSSNIKIRESCASLLGSLAKDDHLIKKLIDRNIIRYVIIGLKSQKSQLIQLSLMLLYNLCQDLDSVLTIGQQGVLLPVVELLNGSSPALAMKTLVALSFSHPNCEEISKTDALNIVVKYMTSEEEELSKMAISTAFLFRKHKVYSEKIEKLLGEKEKKLLKDFQEKGENPII